MRGRCSVTCHIGPHPQELSVRAGWLSPGEWAGYPQASPWAIPGGGGGLSPGEAVGEAVVRLAPGELLPETPRGRRCVDPDQLDPGDDSQVFERLDVHCGTERG